MWCWFKNVCTSSFVPLDRNWKESTHARTNNIRLQISVCGSAIKRQSILDASAVRSMAPIFGFSIFSATSTSGFLFENNSIKIHFFFFTSATIPSVFYDNLFSIHFQLYAPYYYAKFCVPFFYFWCLIFQSNKNFVNFKPAFFSQLEFAFPSTTYITFSSVEDFWISPTMFWWCYFYTRLVSIGVFYLKIFNNFFLLIQQKISF